MSLLEELLHEVAVVGRDAGVVEGDLPIARGDEFPAVLLEMGRSEPVDRFMLCPSIHTYACTHRSLGLPMLAKRSAVCCDWRGPRAEAAAASL